MAKFSFLKRRSQFVFLFLGEERKREREREIFFGVLSLLGSFLFLKMSEKREKRKREVVRSESEEGKRILKRGKKEQIPHDVVVIEDDVDEREQRSEDALGKREQGREREGEEVVIKRRRKEEEEVMKRRRKEEEEKKKRFACGICLELMSWEKEPRLLPCCGLSFCSLCLNKLFLLQNPSSSSSSPSPSSSSSSSSSPSSSSSSSSPSPSSSSEPTEEKKKGVKCPVCREMNECETIEILSMNYLIPETIDVLLSSNLISFSQQPTSGFYFCFFLFFSFLSLWRIID